MEEKIRGIPFDANEVVLPDGSLGYDNVIYSSDFAEWMSTYFKNGILVSGGKILDQELKVTKVDSTHVKINVGNIVVNGRTGFVTSPISVEIPASEPNKFRTDRLVIELNIKETVNCFMLKLIKGETKQNPTPPAITRTDEVYHMSLATITSGVSGINKVKDDRPEESLCGISQVLIGVRPALPVTGDTASNISYDNYYSGNTETVQIALDNLNNPANKIEIKEDGVVTKKLNLTIRESWLNVGRLPLVDGRKLQNTVVWWASYGHPVSIENFLYGYTEATYKFLKFDEKNYEVLCTMPNTNSSYSKYLFKYKNEVYVLVWYSNTLGEIWKFNRDTKSFTKVTNLPVNLNSFYGAVEFQNEVHFFIFRVVSSAQIYEHYKFNGSSITLVTADSPFKSSYLFGVKGGYIYCVDLTTTASSGNLPNRTCKRFDGTSWNDFTISNLNSVPPIKDWATVSYIISDEYFMYLPMGGSEFLKLEGDKFVPDIISTYQESQGPLLMYKGKLTYLNSYQSSTKGGNGSYNNFFVREKILCLEG